MIRIGPRRRGAGILVVSLVGALLALVAMSSRVSFLERHQRGRLSRSVLKDRLEALARSAADEALARLLTDWERPRSALRRRLDRVTLEGSPSASLSIPLRFTPRLLEEPILRGFEVSLDRATLEGVVHHGPASETWSATLVLETTARIRRTGEPPRIRTLVLRYGLKVVRPGPGAPFDRTGLALGSLSPESGLDRLNRERDRAIGETEEFRSLLEDMGSAPGGEVFRNLADRLLPPEELKSRLGAFPESGRLMAIGLWEEEQTFTLEDLDFWRGLEPLARTRRTAFQDMEEAARTVSRGNLPPERAVRAAEGYLEAADEFFLQAWSLQQGLRIIPEGTDLYRELSPFWRTLSREHALLQATYVLETGAGRPPLQRQLDRFLGRFPDATGYLVVRGSSAEESLRLEGELRSGLHIVLDGVDATLGDLRGRPGTPGPTCAVYGGSIRLESTFQGTLILGKGASGNDPVLSLAEGATLQGALLAERLGSGSLLRGRLIRGPRDEPHPLLLKIRPVPSSEVWTWRDRGSSGAIRRGNPDLGHTVDRDRSGR